MGNQTAIIMNVDSGRLHTGQYHYVENSGLEVISNSPVKNTSQVQGSFR